MIRMVIKLPEQYKIYTDGACSQNVEGNWHGGYGVFVDLKEPIKFYGSKLNTTNNQMELMAFKKALEFVHDIVDRYQEQEIIIHTDSAYIHNCLRNRWYDKWKKNGWLTAKKKPVANKILWQNIIDLYEPVKNDITISKVKAHSNVYGNVVADGLAVRGKEEARTNEVKENAYEFLK